MKTKPKNTLDILFHISILTAMIGLFLPFFLSSFTIILLIFFWLIKDSLNQKLVYLKSNKQYFFILSLYAMYLLGMFYTSNGQQGFTILEKNVSLLLLPLLFASTKALSLTKHFKIFLIFSLVNYLLAIFLVVVACYNYTLSEDISVFYYNSFTSIFNYHPVYFAMYLLFSLMIILYGFKKKLLVIHPIILGLLVVFTFLILIFLSSKIILALSVILIFWFIAVSVKNRKKKIIALSVFFIIITFSVLKQTTTSKRIDEVINSEWSLISKDHYAYNEAFTGSTLRIITWKIAIKHLFIDQNPIIGVGPGDSQDFLDQVYAKYGMDAAGYLGFNHHNQFVEILVKLGLLGLLIYCYWIFLFLKKAVFTKSWLYLGFLILFFSVSLTESNLEVHRGIVFFSLFNSLFFFCEGPKQK